MQYKWKQYFYVRPVAKMVCIFLAIGLACSEVISAQTIDDTRKMIEQWVETQRVISKEKHDLKLAKEMLRERIALVQSEIDSLREKIKDTEKTIAEADKKREDLVQENDQLKEVSDMLKEKVSPLEIRTNGLIRRLPDPLQDRVKPLSSRIPSNPEETKLSLSQRFQNVVGVLNELNKSSLEIPVVSEVRDLPNGDSAEVTAIYLGIGHGYYVGKNNTIAGMGTPGEDGWEWKPINDYTGQISEAVSILNNESVASFVQVPVEIQ